uniref:Uncharacterized protein n=1 Tax=Romanomermis culicivorax TaxID=13658 RepID=A0A915HUT1_ROMCU
MRKKDLDEFNPMKFRFLKIYSFQSSSQSILVPHCQQEKYENALLCMASNYSPDLGQTRNV